MGEHRLGIESNLENLGCDSATTIFLAPFKDIIANYVDDQVKENLKSDFVEFDPARKISFQDLESVVFNYQCLKL